MPLPENWADIYKSITTFKTKPSAVFEIVFDKKEKNKMPESIIITPEKEETVTAGMDLDLFLRIMPAVRVGDRIVSTIGIEHVEYQEIVTGDGEESETTIQLGISYQSGSIYFFDDEEEMKLDAALRAAIQKSEEAQKHQMDLAQENIQLKQEIARLMANQMQGGKILPGFGRKH